jgi:hypothetical protein
MAIRVTTSDKESYVAALIQAAEEIKLRADEIVGDIDGQKGIDINFSIEPNNITEISVFKTFISGWKQRSREDKNVGK